MTRLGWFILGVIVLAVAAFASMTTIGTMDGGADPSGARTRWFGPRRPQTPAMLAVPVAGVDRGTIQDSWGDARGGGTRGHHGTDIVAPQGTPAVAVASGTIEKLFQSALGGTTLYLRSADRRWIYYYAHLQGYAPGVHEGQPVKPGDPLGFVGDTGDAGPGNYHLHFGMQRMRADERWWQGEDVDPYPSLTGRGVAGTATSR